MPDLLLELYSEEIPARMQRDAAAGLKSLLCKKLSEFSITFVEAAEYSTPRRVCIAIKGLPESSPVQKIERKGPREGAPENALSGFMRSTGATAKTLELRKEKKGRYYFARIAVPGRPISEIAAEAVKGVVREFVWPKSMVWGTGRLRWVRPLHSILCILHDEKGCSTVDFEIEGIQACDVTRGHRFMSPSEFQVTSFDDYRVKLEQAFVILDPEDRKKRIRDGAERLAEEKGLNLVSDPELLDENAGLTEWPVPMIGAINDRFLYLPKELLTVAMKQHQKYHSAVDPNTRHVTHFIMIANRETKDEGEMILEGNLRVLNSRLEDAEFYWKNDTRSVKMGGLESLAAKLRNMNFHHELGNMEQRVLRISAIAEFLADAAGVEAKAYRRAAELSKIDLVSETVNEYPELQGKVGRLLALRSWEQKKITQEEKKIANACEKHYLPAGPNDPVPSEPLAVAVGLADRIDYLVGFFGIGDISSGSKDPHGLRRAALGVIRLILNNKIRIRLLAVFDFALKQYSDIYAVNHSLNIDVLKFISGRLIVYLRDDGIRKDCIKACVSVHDDDTLAKLKARRVDDLVLISKRAEQLDQFINTDDGINLVKAFKRVNNLFKWVNDARVVEGKIDEQRLDIFPNEDLFKKQEERELMHTIRSISSNNEEAYNTYSNPYLELGSVSTAICNFFDQVHVNSSDTDIRLNRLRLLYYVWKKCMEAADFRQIEI